MRLSLFAIACMASSLAAHAQTTLNPLPSRVLGQHQIQIKADIPNPNLIEGRELLLPQQVALDHSVSPPALYVADSGNHRVLGWRDATGWATGARADIVLGQLDLSSARALGPGTERAAGLNRPTGVAVDGAGNVYVMDAGNNRILRYPKPFEARDSVQSPDMVIGQPGFSTRSANTGGISASTLATNTGSPANGALAIDSQGQLWVSDAYNNRVLRYSAAVLSEGRNGPEADLVLGQPDFITNTAAADTGNLPARLNKSRLRMPSGIAVDAKGRVYVGDGLGRVLVYFPQPQIASSQAASRLLGITVAAQGQSVPRANPINIEEPEGIFLIGEAPAVVDRSLHRVLVFEAPEQWVAEQPNQISPEARAVIGQPTMADFRANQNRPEPNGTTLALPSSGVSLGSEVFISDSGNHRILALPAAGGPATRVLGQDSLNAGAPNLLEGKEMFLFAGFTSLPGLGGTFSDGAGVAIDRRTDPPRLYVADTYNNRVLAYRDARKARYGAHADLIIGQATPFHSLYNAPRNDSSWPSFLGLASPAGIVVDDSGALWIADSGNGRVVRYPDPFKQMAETQTTRPDLVLGQTDFNHRQIDPTSRIMGRPFGLAFTSEGHLAVSDAAYHRVLLFRKPAGGDFVDTQAADKVIGQTDFLTGTRSQGERRLFSPRHLAVDGEDRLYVADAGNNRVTIYNSIAAPLEQEPNDPFPVLTLTGLNVPQGIAVSKETGEIWVGEATGGRVLHYSGFSDLILTQQPDSVLVSQVPLALAQDAAGALYVAEGANRIAMFYNGLSPRNAANQNNVALAPMTLASLYPRVEGSVVFGTQTATAEAPYPQELAGLEVLVNETPAPLIMVSPSKINVLIPSSAPVSGTAEFLVQRKSDGQVLGAGTIDMTPVAPGLFTANESGSGQVRAVNEDGTANSAENRIGWGKVITLLGTGHGPVPGVADGTTPAEAVPTAEKPRVLIGADFVPDENVQFSGTLPGSPGTWQVKVKIPNDIVPSTTVDVVLLYRGRLSNRGLGGQIVRTTIAVKE